MPLATLLILLKNQKQIKMTDTTEMNVLYVTQLYCAVCLFFPVHSISQRRHSENNTAKKSKELQASRSNDEK